MSGKRLPVLDQRTDPGAAPVPRGLARREVVLLGVGWFGTIGSLLAATAAALRGLVPNLLYEPDLRFRLAKPEEYLEGAATFIEEVRLFVQRRGSGYRAMSAVCTHLGCTVNPMAGGAKGFQCPCHGSVFDEDGRVLSGPAPKPLPCYAMNLARDGRLVVDRDREVSADRYLVLSVSPDEPSGEIPA